MNALSTGNFHWEVYPLMVYLKITDSYDMTSSVYRGQKAIMKQSEETMKTDIVFWFV